MPGPGSRLSPFSDATWAEALRHRPLVRKISKQFVGRGVDRADLIQSGMIGLCRAIELHNDSLSKFSTYATAAIKSYMSREIIEHSRTIRIPDDAAIAAGKLIRCRDEGRDASWFDRLPAKTRANVEHAAELISANTWTDQTVAGHVTLAKVLDPNDCPVDHEPFDVERFAVVETFLSRLTVKQRYVVRSWFGVGRRRLDSVEIAKKFGVTASAVKTMKKSAIEKLQKFVLMQAAG